MNDEQPDDDQNEKPKRYRVRWFSRFTGIEGYGEWYDYKPVDALLHGQTDCPGFVHWIEEEIIA